MGGWVGGWVGGTYLEGAGLDFVAADEVLGLSVLPMGG